MWFDQSDYDVRMEWGRAGLPALPGVTDDLAAAWNVSHCAPMLSVEHIAPA